MHLNEPVWNTPCSAHLLFLVVPDLWTLISRFVYLLLDPDAVGSRYFTNYIFGFLYWNKRDLCLAYKKSLYLN